MRKKLLYRPALLAACLLAFYAPALAEDTPPPAVSKPVVANPPTLPEPQPEFAEIAPAMPAGVWFPILPFQARPDAAPQLLPMAVNQPFEGEHTDITRAVIVIHDAARDANAAQALLSMLAGKANDTTIIIAPQFLLSSDILRFTDHLPDGGRDLAYWPLGAWEDGGLSAAEAPQKGVSSFAAIDLLLIFLADKQFFPNLQDISVTGFGAGGDFVLRYVATGLAPDILDQDGIMVRFVPANASSYLYFTAMRPVANKPGFALPKADKCPLYNSYRYGIENLNDYARRTGANAIRLDYITKRVTYLVGENVEVEDRLPDTNCAALLQGPARRARAMNYDFYLGSIFGDDASKLQKFVTIPKVGYDPAGVYGSACGMSVLFGDGDCGTSIIDAKTP